MILALLLLDTYLGWKVLCLYEYILIQIQITIHFRHHHPWSKWAWFILGTITLEVNGLDWDLVFHKASINVHTIASLMGTVPSPALQHAKHVQIKYVPGMYWVSTGMYSSWNSHPSISQSEMTLQHLHHSQTSLLMKIRINVLGLEFRILQHCNDLFQLSCSLPMGNTISHGIAPKQTVQVAQANSAGLWSHHIPVPPSHP